MQRLDKGYRCLTTAAPCSTLWESNACLQRGASNQLHETWSTEHSAIASTHPALIPQCPLFIILGIHGSRWHRQKSRSGVRPCRASEPHLSQWKDLRVDCGIISNTLKPAWIRRHTEWNVAGQVRYDYPKHNFSLFMTTSSLLRLYLPQVVMLCGPW